METLKMIVHKQTISANNYVVPSGNREVYTLKVEFQNSDWDEFTKFAVFYRDDAPDVVYDVIMKNDTAEIPQEVLAKQGIVRAGVLGRLDGKQLMATDLMKINVIKGAPTAIIQPSDTVFEQILDDYAIVNTQLRDIDERLNLYLNGSVADGELLDIRREIDGKVASTAGDAVREQVEMLRENLVRNIKDVIVDDYSKIIYDIDNTEYEIPTWDDIEDIANEFKSVIRYEVTFASLTDAQKQELKGAPGKDGKDGSVEFMNVTASEKAEWLKDYQIKLTAGEGITLSGDGTISCPVYTEATTSKAGLMSASDKSKLDMIYNYIQVLLSKDN